MTAPYTLFEVSWEVCNKVGGIHTVISTKAKTLVEKLGDEYVAIGPWLLSSGTSEATFEEDSRFASFAESCRAMGVPVRIGRWRIPGSPLTILVEFSGLFAEKDAILTHLWEDAKVDSLEGQWDYVEPVMFGWAAGRVIEAWWKDRIEPEGRACVAQFHEWMVGSGMLYLKTNVPAIGTVFTTHATMLGRSLSSTGKLPEDGLAGRTPDDAARVTGIRAKHSLEGVCVRDSDVFTTVSNITSKEAELFFGRRAEPLLPNGIDLRVIDELAGDSTRTEVEARLRELAWRCTGEDPADAMLACISGRYEFHNKGIDLLLDSCARMNGRGGRKLVLFVLVPAGNSGLKGALLDRLARPAHETKGTIGVSTHNLFDESRDPVQRRCVERGLVNTIGSRVKVIHVPIYLDTNDGLLDLPYEAVLRAMEVSCFPSFYEPWGYTPEESLAVGVPTITTDCAGFGQWALENNLSSERGVIVFKREAAARIKNGFDTLIDPLAEMLEAYMRETRDRDATYLTCRETAQLTAWSGLIANYEQAFASAIKAADLRAPRVPRPARRRRALQVVPPQQGSRPRLMKFHVAASFPEPLKGLERLARNLWWSWDPDAVALFRDLSPGKWAENHHNPITFLRDVFTKDVERFESDAAYVKRLNTVLARFDAYTANPSPSIRSGSSDAITTTNPVAYFCAEFGIHESLKIYSGGLGILAGDHLKSASDLDIPLIGVGLFYKKGYFAQRLTLTGEQISDEFENDPRDLPMEPVLDENGKVLHIDLQLPSSNLQLRAWKVRVGRVTLYLMDSDVEANRPEDREITRQLYGGDHETRLRQEIVLGRGGKRLLSRLAIHPACFHINEGHAAFLVLERVSRLVGKLGLTFDEAREFVRATTVFTTHTPVPAGHDRFGEDLMRRYFADAPAWVGVPWERFFALGCAEDDKGSFNMSYLAMNFASFVNGVSRLHGEVSQKLLHPFWPRLLETEVPVTSITNGVHLPTWTHPGMRALLGVQSRPIQAADFAKSAKKVADEPLWNLRSENKAKLVDVLRTTLSTRNAERGESPSRLERMQQGLDPNALWIGFARRFAPYKRAQLLFRDRARLKAILEQKDRPVRFVFAGKAHPKDKHGQEILKSVVELTRSDEFLGKIFFVEDYDIEIARTLVQGVDVWLNNPTRPLEASGTSGMKVSANGGLNLSILDGWWIEAHEIDEKNGWAIGKGATYSTQELQDEEDVVQLYRLLEGEVVPLFYDRDAKGVPKRWLERVKINLATIPPTFNTDRMVREYTDRAYVHLGAAWFSMQENRFEPARKRSERAQAIQQGFASIKIKEAQIADVSTLRVGDSLDVRVDVELGTLTPEDVAVELVLGHTRGGSDLDMPIVLVLDPIQSKKNGVRTFEGQHKIARSGSFSYGIRVRARSTADLDLSTRDLVLWA
ncbi:MAG: alpha-glucan family phosphorylase [Planctomycetota bacterium]|nr:alpha-glucan family phosphorylase [Planctomycetota bacterium]